MADLDLATRLSDHNQYCTAKRRLFAPLAVLGWVASYAAAALVATLLGCEGALFQVVLWLAMAALAVDGWWQLRAYAARDAHRVALATGAVMPTAAALAERRAWARRGLLAAEGADAWRAPLRVLCAAPRLSASAWHAPEDALPWTQGDLTRAAAALNAIGARGQGWQAVTLAGEDAELVPGMAALGVLEMRLGEAGGEMRVPGGLWQRHFAKPKPQMDVFRVPEG